jgi:hypothetical protein
MVELCCAISSSLSVGGLRKGATWELFCDSVIGTGRVTSLSQLL